MIICCFSTKNAYLNGDDDCMSDEKEVREDQRRFSIGVVDRDIPLGLKEVMDALPFYAMLIDESHHILFANKAVETYLGVDSAKLIGEYCPKAIHNLDQPFPGCPLEEAAEKNRILERELFEQNSGQWMRSAIYPTEHKTERGHRIFVHMVHDITEQKQAQEALLDSEANYRDLADSIADVFFAMDTDLRYTFWNKASENLTGIQAEEAIGKSLYELFPDTKGTKTEEMYLNVLRTRSPACFESPYRIQDRDYFFEICAYPSNVGLCCFVRDVTERKEAEEEAQDALRKLREALRGIIQVIALTVETKDPYTAGHQRRVADLAHAIAREMGLSNDQVNGIAAAGFIHDIGKISVPSEILAKPGRISETELALVKNHPQIGYDILKTIEFPWPIAQTVLQHHERMNGSGYPSGLSGDGILLEARILAVADVVEAMASHRPYRAALGVSEALEEILGNKGTLYDPDVVDACVRLLTEKDFDFDQE